MIFVMQQRRSVRMNCNRYFCIDCYFKNEKILFKKRQTKKQKAHRAVVC